MNALKSLRFVSLQECRESARGRALGRVLALASLAVAGCLAGCHEKPPPPARSATPERVTVAREDEPTPLASTTAHRARVGHGAELYLPPWFHARRGGYDLVVHFHGMRELQEKNIEQVQLDAAVVSVNLGVGTDPYAAAFRDPKVFTKLLEDVDAEIARSGRAPGAHRRRLALSAWSAGFVSAQRVLASKELAAQVDAVLLADGFFTSYANLEKKTINTESLLPFVDLAAAATRGEKLFVITHTAIPTTGYPSVTDTVAKLLELASLERVPSNGEVGSRHLQRTYAVDKGDLHIHGYAGVTATDHINQIRAMGETVYPYLRDRWNKDAPRAAR